MLRIFASFIDCILKIIIGTIVELLSLTPSPLLAQFFRHILGLFMSFLSIIYISNISHRSFINW